MREMQPAEFGNGPLADQLAVTGQYYPVHPSRYTMHIMESIDGDNAHLWWRIHLDMQIVQITAGYWHNASNAWHIWAWPGDPWVMYGSATVPATAWDAHWLMAGPSYPLPDNFAVQPTILFIPGAECARPHGDGGLCHGAICTAVPCRHGEGANGQHAPVELTLWSPWVLGYFKGEYARLRGAVPRVPGGGTWPRLLGRHGFRIPADPHQAGEDPGEAGEA